MSLGTLPIVLLVFFGVSIVGSIISCLLVIWRRRSFRHRSSPAPPIRGHETANFFNFEAATKELQYFFRLKPLAHEVELDPHDPPVKDTDGSSIDDEVVDVFKLKEVNGLSRFLSTIKEDKEEVESTPDVDFSIKQEEDDVVVVMVDEDERHAKTVFSTPCDSPVYFTPVGSPLRGDVIESSVLAVSGI